MLINDPTESGKIKIISGTFGGRGIYVYNYDNGPKHTFIPFRYIEIWDNIWGLVAYAKDSKTLYISANTIDSHEDEDDGNGPWLLG